MTFLRVSIVSVLIVLLHVNDFVKGQSEENTLKQRYLDLYTTSPYPKPKHKDRFVPAGAPAIPEKFRPYNLTAISARCQKNAFFASFDPNHAEAVNILTEYFIQQGEEKSLVELANFCKTSSHINAKVWYSALTRARLVVPTPNFPSNIPNPIQLFPTSLFPAALLENDTKPEECVVLDESFGEDNGIENRLWYFREDVAMNAHHWIWHLLNPFSSNSTTPKIDRRGENFYFFHHEILARYHAERLSNGLAIKPPTDALNKDTILEEGYNPHLTDGISTLPFAERRPNLNIYESLPPPVQEIYLNISTQRNRILDTINQGGILHNEGFVELKAFDRINLLGDLTEASITSIYPQHYGRSGIHNQGHVFIAMTGAPPNGPFGAMIEQTTAMRDIVFYRWHNYLDVVFQSYKLTHLKPYAPRGGDYPLIFDGVAVQSVKVIPESIHGESVAANYLQTYWNMREFDVGTGLDFAVNRTLNVCAKHLDHQEFKYHINIDNSLDKTVLGTVRIFLAPRFKSLKEKRRYTILEQRSLFFTLDSFQTVLQPGSNFVPRKSTDSTLTAGWPKSILEIADAIVRGEDPSKTDCDCGFPHHLLLPKGTLKGMVFDLFVMVTNGLEDRVDNNSTFSEPNENDKCIPSHVFCGLQSRKYPDSKPMGYPFDRRPYSVKHVTFLPLAQHIEEERVVENLEEYVHYIPNMHASQIVIQHRNELRTDNLHSKSKLKLLKGTWMLSTQLGSRIINGL